jgi:hypothetical protein
MASGYWQSFRRTAVDLALNALTTAGSVVCTSPNPFEGNTYTACICLVFNSAGRADPNFKTDDTRTIVFAEFKSAWCSRHDNGRFFAVVPYDECGKLTLQWRNLIALADSAGAEVLGLPPRPLITVVGHCSPGSSAICSDDGKAYDVNQVLDVIEPLLQPRCTIYLTPCSTAVQTSASQSFLSQFAAALQDRVMVTHMQPDTEILIVGMNSISIPAKGIVLATGHTYVSVTLNGAAPIDEQTFLERQNQN